MKGKSSIPPPRFGSKKRSSTEIAEAEEDQVQVQEPTVMAQPEPVVEKLSSEPITTAGLEGSAKEGPKQNTALLLAQRSLPNVPLFTRRLETPEQIAEWREERRKRFPRMKKAGHNVGAQSAATNNPLLGLMSGYGDDEGDSDSDADEATEAGPNGKSSNGAPQPKRRRTGPKLAQLCRYFLLGKCHKGDRCIHSHGETSGAAILHASHAPGGKGFLTKLLAKEILQDYNVILQCTRYIAQQNLFEESTHCSQT
eukprot:Clim_evm20s237 gene=Clim_evmTU20s237